MGSGWRSGWRSGVNGRLPRLSAMDPVLIVGVVVGVLIVIALLSAALRAMRPRVPDVTEAYTNGAAAAVLPPHVVAEIDELVRRENRIAAIKTLRDHTDESLASAKRRIDHWTVGASPATTAIPVTPPPQDVGSVRSTLPADVVAEIDRLVAAEQPIVAIKLLREHTGFGLKASKDLIDAWQASGSL